MKKIFFILFSFLSSMFAAAQQYKILYLNTAFITIGEKKCQLGDVFDKKDVIKWQDEKQVMKVEDLSNNEQYVISPRLLGQKATSNTIAAYINVRKSMASRSGEMKQQYELAQFFSIPIDLDKEWRVGFILNEPDAIYYIEYEYEGESINKKINYKDGELYITKQELYQIDGIDIPQKPITAKLYYYNPLEKTSQFLSETIILPR